MSRLRVVGEFIAARWLRPLRTRACVERRQRRLLRRQLRFLRTRSAYFAARIPRGTTDLRSLPLMDKGVLMDRFDELNTVGVRRADAMRIALGNERTRDFAPGIGTHSVGLSSGTSGHRGLFLVARAERERWAGNVLARTLPRGRILGQRIALFLRADNTLYEEVASRAVSFSFFDVFAELKTNLARLEAYAPTILVAPPSVLLEIARAVQRGVLGVAPTKVYAVAEVLELSDERRIAAALGQERIHQLYQCTEGFLAHTCDEGVLHLNEDGILVEREELGDGRFVPILTDLRRRAQPIVRYRLGDVLRLREAPCPCGSALTAIARIEGREGDTLSLPGHDGGMVPIFADLVSRALLYVDGVEEYRVVQTGRRTFEIGLRCSDDAAEEAVRGGVVAELGSLADRQRAVRAELRFVPYAPDGSRKLRRVERRWRGEADDAQL
ncbi:F390 synthetase-related protein [uncultured Microbacterium sp.]|uniref:F390 synthetase-related protein n=1 Tax=uncultured Microbacterium sp. TaxID=191216 RepID=UPI0025DC3257|nr:F390 synthetase-related protein [uncultured Microbacterium sp.]